jgi:tRNA(Ile)-lysidine synthase TilS/MesJ
MMTRSPNVSGRIFSKIGKAISRFGMIAQDDRITVGLSGGKDSVLLLLGLVGLRERSPVRFSLRASMVDITNGECDTGPMEDLCGSLGIPFNRITCPVLEVIRAREEKSPCSLCSKMRAGVLFTDALQNGSTTVAMGHNLDDAVETVLLNLFYAGRFRSFHPRSWRSRTGLWLIRPLVFLSSSEITEEIGRLGIELIPPLCPFSRDSKRERIKELVRSLEKEIPDVRSQLLHALMEPYSGDNWS